MLIKKLKLIIFTCLFSLLILSNSIITFADAEVVPVTLPTFNVTMNGEKIDNDYNKYPFLVYKGITYFPMTYVNSRYLGLETKWNQTTGLEINKTNVSYPYIQHPNKKNAKNNYASIASFAIKVNDKTLKNSDEEYPLLTFRDVTYFPLTWEFVVDEFSWKYSFDNSSGLNITSQNIVPQELKLKDYMPGGDYIIEGENIYYAGNNGAVYTASINNLEDCKKIFETPLNEMYGPEGAHAYPYFKVLEGRLYFTYHVGGAVMGTSYEVEIYDDATVSEAIALRGYGAGGPGKEIINGYAMDWSSKSEVGSALYRYGWYRTTRYETEEFDYVIAYNINNNDYMGIYKLNKNINSIYPITEKNMSVEYFKYREENIYFINQGNLYSFTVGEDIVKTVNGMDNVPVDSFEILDENIYYVNGDDLKIYMIGITESLNSGETAEEIVLLGDYVMLKFNSTVPNSYRTMIYDRAGNQVFKSTAHMNVIHNYSDIIVYYDDIMSKVFTIGLK